jgi:hypothetical protein
MDGLERLQEGAQVRVFGLIKAAQHNGKLGRISGKRGRDERVGVELEDGAVLAVKRENLELVRAAQASSSAPPSASVMPEGKERTLTRDSALLREFAGNPDPDVFALYFHFNDQSYDCFNAAEYTTQMLRYYACGITVRVVVPRMLRDDPCFLVCLQHKDPDKNSLCNVAFQCMRQFTGISMLVKQRCFVCNKPGANMWACSCVCYCSEECKARGSDSDKKLCELVRASPVSSSADEVGETVQLLG